MRISLPSAACLLLSAALFVGCEESSPLPTQLPTTPGVADRIMDSGPYELGPPVFDIAAAPDGSILLAQGTEILEIRKGEIRDVTSVPASTPPDQQAKGFFPTVNGLAVDGRGDFFATTGGGDLAVASGVWHVSRGQARLVGDIHAFESANDPDAFEGPRWKDQRCEGTAVYTAGPQSNPYHVTRLNGSTALVGDAAGNTVLAASKDGKVDWVAVVTPPVADGSASTDPADWLQNPVAGVPVPCYAQPVPTSVAIGPDGAYYVGELSGSSESQPLGATGVSRVWRIEPGSRHVVCPSPACTPVLTGLTTVIDLAFGPDGDLYVVEYDLGGWLAPLVPPATPGYSTIGDLRRCDVDAGTCQIVAGGLSLPSAITFDKRGDLWLLQDNFFAPKIRRMELD